MTARILSMSRHLPVMILLILLAFAVRLCALDGKSIWSDEALSLYRARHDIPFILSGRIIIRDVVTRDTQPPLYFLLLHALVATAGTSTFAAKYLSAAFSILAVPLLYVLGHRLIGRTGGLFGGLISAISPVYLWYAQEIRMYTLLVALSATSVYTLFRALERRQHRMRWGLGYLLVTAAMLYTHYTGFFVLGFEGLFVLVQSVRYRRWWLLVPAAGSALVAMPLLPFAVRRLRLGPERDFHFVPLPIILRDLWNSFSVGISIPLEPAIPLSLIFLVLWLLGVASCLRQGPVIGWLLLGYLFVPILSLYALTYVKPLYQGVRHLLIVSPAYYLLIAAGLAALYCRTRALTLGALGLVMVGVAIPTHNYFTDPAYLKDDLRGLAWYFELHRGPNDALVLSDDVLSLAFEYYLGEEAPIEAIPRYGMPLGPDFPADIRALLDRYDRLWFMAPVPSVRQWLDRNLFQVDEIYFEGMTTSVMLAAYEGRPIELAQPPAYLRGVPTQLGDHLMFHGYDVSHNPAVAGQVLRVELYWEPRATLSRDYNIALSLVDEADNPWGQGDSAPFRGLHPTSSWAAHTIVREPHELMVNLGTPPGTYRLMLRVYDPATGDPLPLENGALSAHLGSIQVVRPETPPHLRDLRPLTPRRVDFGRRLRLLGFDLATGVRRPGEEIRLATHWQALRPLKQDYRLWLRLVAGHRTLAEVTIPPTRADYPTSHWRAGDILTGQHRLIVPADAPAGLARVVLSVVDPAGRPLTAHRLSWLPIGPTEIQLATVEIPPPADRVTEPPPMQYTLNAKLGDGIELLGYDLSRGQIHPGASVDVVLYWRTNQEPEGNFKATVQVLSTENLVIGQHDSVPANWSRPTAGWLPGEVIVDPHPVTVRADAAPGTYRLIAALYDPVTGSRLPVTQADEIRDHVVLGTLTLR